MSEEDEGWACDVKGETYSAIKFALWQTAVKCYSKAYDKDVVTRATRRWN